jgi:SMC interacting uncharacterized protein involved in chromosome segregation
MTDEMLNAIREIVRSEIAALHTSLESSFAEQPAVAQRMEIERLKAHIQVLRNSSKNATNDNNALHALLQAQTQRTEVERARAERTRIELVQAQRTIDALRADLVNLWRRYNTREHRND